MKIKNMRWTLYLLAPIIVITLCATFLGNPLVFDDNYFFMPGAPEKFFADGEHLLTPRWWVYETLAATFVLAGAELHWLRLGNLLVHMASALTLYFLIRRLLVDLDQKLAANLSAETAAFISAFFFAIHPLAIFTQGYLIQRTIVCATLFSLLSWLAFWRGLSGSRSALWLSCPLFVIAVYAKEHAVMAPAVAFGLLLLYQRSGLKPRLSWPEIGSALLLQGLLALFIVFKIKGIIGTPYEIMTTEVLAGETSPAVPMLYPLSVLSQAGAFFKYLFLWLLPNPAAISLDIRQAFPLDFASWSLWAGAAFYVSYGIGSLTLLWRGGVSGLVGWALLAPWLLFATEFAAVRLQEPFVLYRSYLWTPALFLLLALGMRRLSRGMANILLPLFALCLLALSFDRLTTLSHPYLVWNEAAHLLEKGGQADDIFGAYRIYYNRGNAFLNEGMQEPAIADYQHVLKLKPSFGHAHHQLGVIYLNSKQWNQALQNFDQAVALMPENINSHLGRAQALEALGNTGEAGKSRQTACTLGNSASCIDTSK
jgi:protein O-mannosyl-transferase